MNEPIIIEGTFARVSAGNCSTRWLLDGDDIQARADAALDPYWGNKATIYERGFVGAAIATDAGQIVEVFASRAAAARVAQ